MLEKIQNIIRKSYEPVIEIDSFISGLTDEQKINEAWDCLLNIALNGKMDDRYISLSIIAINNPDIVNEYSLELINEFNFKKYGLLLKPILEICSKIATKEHIDFIFKTLDFSKKNNDESLYKLVIRNIISTDYWERGMDEIATLIEKSNDKYVIDLVAYFKYKNKEKQHYSNFLKLLSYELRKKIQNFDNDIKIRYDLAYSDL